MWRRKAIASIPCMGYQSKASVDISTATSEVALQCPLKESEKVKGVWFCSNNNAIKSQKKKKGTCRIECKSSTLYPLRSIGIANREITTSLSG